MNRRKFLIGCAWSGMSATLADAVLAQPTDPWTNEFSQALVADPSLEGYAGIAFDTTFSAKVAFAGKPPASLAGTLYRNGPALHEFGGLRYHHWFDGDGMAHAFQIADGNLTHTGRLVLTEKLAAETKAGRRLRAGFGTALANGERPSSRDSLNTANTNILLFAGELLALWEGGSATRLDPGTLATYGPKIWRADLKGMPFSAHPKLDRHGTMWNFGLDSLSGLLVLYEIGPDGVPARVEAMQLPDMSMIHDFAVTARHLVFLLPPLRFVRESFESGLSFLDSHEEIADAPMRVLVVDKSDLATHRVYELEHGFAFHLGNAWDDESGVIRFDYVRADDASRMLVGFKEIMRGTTKASKPSQSTHVTLDTRAGRCAQQTIVGGVEFPRVDERVTGERYRYLYQASQIGEGAIGRGFDAVRRLDVDSGAIDQYFYGSEFLAEEHIFVSESAHSAEGAGFLLGTVLDLRRRRTLLSVFDAMNLAGGPIAQAILPHALPLGLHGNFQAA